MGFGVATKPKTGVASVTTNYPDISERTAQMPKIKDVVRVRIPCAGHLPCQTCDSRGIEVFAVGSRHGDAEEARCINCGTAASDCNELLECEVLVYWNNALNLLSFPRQCPTCFIQIDDTDVKAEAERWARKAIESREDDAA